MAHQVGTLHTVGIFLFLPLHRQQRLDIGSANAIDGRRCEMLEVIIAEANRLSEFIDGVIELSRVKADAIELHHYYVSVDDVITTVQRRR